MKDRQLKYHDNYFYYIGGCNDTFSSIIWFLQFLERFHWFPDFFISYSMLTFSLFILLRQLMGCMHSLNFVFLLLDTALNSLVCCILIRCWSRKSNFLYSELKQNDLCFFQPFPWFRMAYFVLWSCIYVIFQWILHARGFSWWACYFVNVFYYIRV